MGTGDILLGGNPVRDGLAFRPGGSSNTRRYASCYGNRYKLRPCGPLALPTFTSLKQVQGLELHLVHPSPHQHLHPIHTSVSVITGRTLTIVAKVTTWRLFAKRDIASALIKATTMKLAWVSCFLMISTNQVQRASSDIEGRPAKSHSTVRKKCQWKAYC